MSDIFLQILNMSLGAAYVIVAVIILRFLLKKAPKILSYSLWAVVLFRLVCPFSIESALSLFKMNPKPIASDIVYSELPTINTQIDIVDKAINPVLATQAPALVPVASANPMQIVVAIGTFVWVFGMAIMLVYSIISLLILKKRLVGAVRLEGNIWLCDGIKSPFVLGLFRPQIYLPSSLDEADRKYILMHEQNHIRRLDHVVKIIGFASLCLHWFNPLAWVAFFLFTKDMEMSCDEKVLKALNSDVRSEYSALLLSLATGRRIVAGSPLAFGEGNTKSRIKNVMSYKKPAFWVVIIGITAVVGITVGLMLNPPSAILRTETLDNFGTVMEITQELDFPEGIAPFDVKTGYEGSVSPEPKEILLMILADEETIKELKNSEGSGIYHENAYLLFSRVKDAQKITFEFTNPSGNLSMVFLRTDANLAVGGDIWSFSETAKKYSDLKTILSQLQNDEQSVSSDTEYQNNTNNSSSTTPAHLINGALGEMLNLADAATIKVQNSDSTAWEEASLETLINSDNADFIAEFDGWCYGMTGDGNAVKVSVGDSFGGFKVSEATTLIKFQAGENSDEKTAYIMRSEFILGGNYIINGFLMINDGYYAGDLEFSADKSVFGNMPMPITDYALQNGLKADGGKVFFWLGAPSSYDFDLSSVPDDGEGIAVAPVLNNISFQVAEMKDSINSATLVSLVNEASDYPDVPADVQTIFNQSGRTVTGLLGETSDTLPASLSANVRSEPTVFYWITANVLCSDIGYDITPYLGKDIDIEVYKIGFSDDYNIMQRGIIYSFDGKIIGAVIDKKLGLEYIKSLSFNNLEDITGMTLDDYWHKNYYDETDPVNVSATKRNARELVEYYHNAVVENAPERYYECYSPEKKVQNLFINVDASKPYNMPNYSDFTGYITSFKLKSMKKYWFDDDFYMQEDENEANENARAGRYNVNFETEAREGTWAAIDGYKSRFITIVEENGILYISAIGTGP